MGSNMVQRLMKAGHECVVSDTHPQAVKDVVAKGAKSSDSIADFAKKLSKPRAVWMMVPAAVVDSVLTSLTSVLEPGDIVIDGGNSYYHDDIRRSGELKSKGIHYVDCGTSGGVWGSERGYCLMIGGDCESSRSDLQGVGSRCWVSGADAGADRRAFDIGKRLPALRPERSGSLRKDGPQRYRVRNDGSLCRRVKHYKER
jgi:3-hydroxyisobutyrate dehydrogenase-like beta-hydroxyacid dehydrogenase